MKTTTLDYQIIITNTATNRYASIRFLMKLIIVMKVLDVPWLRKLIKEIYS
jgi:hypothetical protein